MQFAWGGGVRRVRDVAPLLLGNFIFRPILRKLAVIFGQQLITFNSNNFTLSSMFSFHMRGPEKEKQCTLREAKQNALEYYCYPLICFPNTILSR